ncbi:UTP--glucose-1-phosphate uridylyltransferase GalU [Candidatus Williamhamiltonella defendens]|uniref:UTP--glucose-1-phosphate uridylyltransferase GalU n=1 Tax=Candidatus Williamhamiltonella defendens TaxID=138072 RepID=UPI00130E4C07|nr:UTP--glucose-1-phosphate uridylyltransferase GalU [Candidatus Hamiltonella defensa]
MPQKLKAIIPVAGLGTRMLPATKAIPKEMLPMVDKPLIQYIVNESVLAGVKEIVLVTHSSKNAIENHFDTSFELEAVLEARVKRQLLQEVQNICPSDVTIMHIRQGQAKGLGHAILCSRPIIGDAPFVILLPDVLLETPSVDCLKENLTCMIERFSETARSQIMVAPIPLEEVCKYGIADCGNVIVFPGQAALIKAMVEKPSLKDTPSHLAVVGRYVLSSDVWPLLEKTSPGTGGEIQLTDAIDMLIETQPVEAFHMTGKWHDCGDKLGYMKAFVEYALRHETEGSAFLNWLKNQNF